MNILIFETNELGDALVFLPTLRAAADAWPRALIRVVCTKTGAEVFRGTIPGVEPITVEKPPSLSGTGMRSLLELLWRLRSERYDLALHSHDDGSLNYAVTAALRIPRRIGFSYASARVAFLLTEVIPSDESRNVTDLNLDLVRRAANLPDLAPRRAPVSFTAEDSEIVAQRLARVGVHPGVSLAIIHPGASLAYREWGIEKFIRVAHFLQAKTTLQPIFIAHRAPLLGVPFPVIDSLSIKQLACLLAMSQLFVGNNSGPMHLAAAMGTPTFALQGPASPCWTIPWADVPHRQITLDGLPCIPCERLHFIPGKCANAERPRGCLVEMTPEFVQESLWNFVTQYSAHVLRKAGPIPISSGQGLLAPPNA